MKYKTQRQDGDWDFHNVSWMTEDNLPEGAIALTDQEWEDRLKPSAEQELENARKSKLRELETKRKEFQYSNLEVGGNVYINTETAQNKFFNKLANTSFPMEWRLADLTWVQLSEIDANTVKDAIIARETLAYQTETNYYNDITREDITLEALNNINIEF